jgi:hypothetical protein
MSFTATNNLQSDTNITLRDQQHAAKLFNVDQFRLAPKSKFLFHVAFNINVGALKNANLVQRYGNEINMLVKSVDLPNYKIDTEMLNQYNRKKVMQFGHKPLEIGIQFHDDNMGLINQLWQNYYSYYYADSTSAGQGGAYNRTATRNSDFIRTPYGLDNGSTAPFFNYIKIYQMARHEFVCYQLVNPVITSWNHNKVDYSNTKTHDFDMKLLYEAVNYSVGAVEAGSPEGFGIDHYDTTPSPLTGINPDPTVYNPSFVASLDLETAAPGILNTVIGQINSAQNSKLPQTATANSSLTLANNIQSISGIANTAFPQASTLSSITTATQVNI